MYISPNSTVKLLTNVPLDNTYEHSVNFATTSAQTTWFNGYVKSGMIFDRQYYQRHSNNQIKLEVLADNIYDCNYMMFQNTSYGSKWFYAFITNIEYVNNNVTLVDYEIDNLQTWLLDFELKPCFVEREHSMTDIIGENLLPDNFDIGEPIAVGRETFIANRPSVGYSNICIVVAATFDKNYVDRAGGQYTNGYSGLYYNVFTGANMINDVVAFISNAGTRINNIINVFYAFSPLVLDTNNEPRTDNRVLSRTAPKTFTAFEGYVPKNAKLWTYPYCYCKVKDGFGDYAEYKYEYFSSTPNFEVTGDLSPTPSVICIPKNYKGEEYNHEESFILSGFPQCAWNSDAYVAWLAQTGIRLASSATANTLAGAVGGGLTGAVAGLAEGLLGEVNNILKSGLTVMANRRQIGGAQGSMLAVAANLLFIEAEQMQIRGEYARIVDSYFTKFGYPVRRVKIPVYSARPYWNYVRTVGCMAVGKVPAYALRSICSIFDKGITWWSSNAVIGDYENQNNSPVI